MSTFSEREEFLSRALHAAVDGIEPGADGLQRIQRRLRRPRPVAMAWAEAAWTEIILRAPGVFQSALEWVSKVTRLAWERFGPTTRTGGGRTARTLRWLRPLAALGVTVSIVAVGAYVALDAQQVISPSNSSSAQSPGGLPGSGGGAGGGSGGATSKSNAPVGGFFPFGGSSASPNCASAKPKASPSSPGIGPIIPPSPTPSTSSSDSGTGSPSPSASDSSTPNPQSSGTTAPGGGPTTSASAPVAGGSSSPATTRRKKPNVSPSPCARNTVTRNSLPPVVNPQTQSSAPAAQVTPSTNSTDSESPAALGFARLELAG